MNLTKISLILWWIEHIYHFEWCILWAGIIVCIDIDYAIIYSIIHLLIKSWANWGIPVRREFNLAILKDIINYE